MKTKELNSLDVQSLEVKVDELRRELFKLRLNQATSPAKSYPSMKRALQKDVARALTILRQKVS